jgi:hypothetical protein
MRAGRLLLRLAGTAAIALVLNEGGGEKRQQQCKQKESRYNK